MPADSGFLPHEVQKRSDNGLAGQLPEVESRTSTISERLGYGSWAIAAVSRPLRRSDWIVCVAAAAGGDIFNTMLLRRLLRTVLGGHRTDQHKCPVEGV